MVGGAVPRVVSSQLQVCPLPLWSSNISNIPTPMESSTFEAYEGVGGGGGQNSVFIKKMSQFLRPGKSIRHDFAARHLYR